MAIPRPKILTRVTIPTGGWDLRISIDNGGTFNLNLDVTMAAGDYYVSFDQQSDDFAQELMLRLYNALDACAVPAYNPANLIGKPFFTLNEDGTVRATVRSPRDVRIQWPALDGPSIGAVLGFDVSANMDLDSGSSYTATSTYQHAYGWYADEDAQLQNHLVEDIEHIKAFQKRTLGGQVVTSEYTEFYTNVLKLQHLSKTLTFSNGTDYTSSPPAPYAQNKALECWWNEAIKGTPFRVYRDSLLDESGDDILANVDHFGNSTSTTDTTLTDTNQSWNITPQEHVGKILAVEAGDSISSPTIAWLRYHIDSHTADTITVPAHVNSQKLDEENNNYYILDHRYRTYVLNTASMSMFSPDELPGIERYNVSIPLRRYV